LIKSGFKSPVKQDIRTEIWVKLWGNVAFNPISALTGATLKAICEDPATRAVARAVMNEAEAVAGRLGIAMPINVERRIDRAGAVGEHKTSMLQDFERGRRTEIDFINGYVARLGKEAGIGVAMNEAITAVVHSIEQRQIAPHPDRLKELSRLRDAP